MIATPTEALVTPNNSQNQLAAANLSRVDWKLNHIADPGMESWTTAHDLEGVSTYRTNEHFVWYATDQTGFVNEGTRSRGIQTRAVDPNHPGEGYISKSSWVYWDNPTNLTMKFDWYIDSIPEPIDYDYFRLNIYLGSPGDVHMYYYFNCEDTARTNTSNYMYFFIDEPTQTWNTFERNITEDFFSIAAAYPTEFQQFRFEQRTRSSEYSRAFIDDLVMANGTIIYGGTIGNGDFEANTGWYSGTNNDPADIAQNSIRQEGNWSANVTASSNGNQSRAQVSYSPDRYLSSLNSDTFSFQWMIDEFNGANEDTFAYVVISCYNESESFNIFYNLAYGENTNTYAWEGVGIINATGFNTTGQWNTFSRSIWEDISSFNETDYVIVDEIEINVWARGQTSRISILFDDIQFESAAIDDQGYEDQRNVGDNILPWDSSTFTVTNTSHSGTKAANLTIANGNSFGNGIEFENRFLNDNTDLWLDFFWRIEDDSGNATNVLYLEMYFESGESLAYIFVNHSTVPSSNGFDEYIMLPEVNTVGSWINFQRNLFNDFTDVFGHEPDTKINEFYLVAESDGGGRLSVLFDDVYLYNDPAPSISGIQTTAQIANRDVNVTAVVEDLSSFIVSLYYKIEDGSWNDVTMVYTGSGFNATIPGQVSDTHVTFYVEAVDEFGQISRSSEITYLIPTDPDPLPTTVDYTPLIVGGIIVAAVVGVIVVYYFVIRPKQSPE
jgi:hypothetical protein